MILKLKTLEISDFKGIKSLTLHLDGNDVRINGANASGKTTVADAFSWLLFGKDAEGDKDFPVKPKDAEGNEVHHLTTTVVGVFETDLGEVVLKRALTEKWVRPRGAVEASFSGNTETFSINSAEMKKGEYADYVRKLIGCDDMIFAMITSPTYFNGLDWKARRDILRLLVPADMERKVIESPEFDDVRELLYPHMYKPDTLLKIIRDEKKVLDKELDSIPAQIKALQSMTYPVTEQEAKDAEYSITDARKTIETLDTLIAEAMSGGALNPLILERDKAKADLNNAESEYQRAVFDYEHKKGELDASIQRHGYKLVDLRSRLEEAEHEAEKSDAKIAALREQRKKIKEEPFDDKQVIDTCPTCGNPLTEEQIAEARENLYAQFVNDKFSKVTRISEEAKREKRDGEKVRGVIASLQEELATYEQAQNREREQRAALIKPSKEAIAMATERYEAAKAAYLEAMKDDEGAEKKVQELKARREEMRERIERATDVLKAVSAASEMQKRIDALESDRKRIAAQIANNEVREGEVREYRLRCSKRLEEIVNDHFPTVFFRLTETKINGNVEDCCECYVRNAETGALVPWEKANGAGKINAGLEIVNVLSDHYGIAVPVIIDNAESVNKLIRTNGQQIALTVTEDKELRMEIMKEEK